MSGGAGPSKKKKMHHFIMGGGLFFHDDIFKVRLSHLLIYCHNTKEGKCGAASTLHSYCPDYASLADSIQRKSSE